MFNQTDINQISVKLKMKGTLYKLQIKKNMTKTACHKCWTKCIYVYIFFTCADKIVIKTDHHIN